MKNFSIFLLVVLIAGGAYFLGRRSGESAAPAVVAAPASTAPVVQQKPGPDGDFAKPSEPVRTYRGPDGRAHIISYDDKNPPDSSDPEQVRKALLSDMKWYPTNIQRNYDQSPADVKAMLDGKKPIPDFMLPAPGGPETAK